MLYVGGGGSHMFVPCLVAVSAVPVDCTFCLVYEPALVAISAVLVVRTCRSVLEP